MFDTALVISQASLKEVRSCGVGYGDIGQAGLVDQPHIALD